MRTNAAMYPFVRPLQSFSHRPQAKELMIEFFPDKLRGVARATPCFGERSSMANPVNERARLLANDPVGPRLYLMRLAAPTIARTARPGQFVHMQIPAAAEHILRRPFCVYARDEQAGTIDVLYQVVGAGTRLLAKATSQMVDAQGGMSVLGPLGNSWEAANKARRGESLHVLLVGGGVGAAPLYLLAEELVQGGSSVDVVLGAQTKDALVTRERFAKLLGREPLCATDDGSFGRPGFCTTLSEEALRVGSSVDGALFDRVCVCGPDPLMKIVASQARAAHVPCEVSTERRMACGIGACLSCVVETVDGLKRSCADGPIFDAEKVVW